MATFLTFLKCWHSSATLYEAYVSLSNQYMHVVMHIHFVLTVFLSFIDVIFHFEQLSFLYVSPAAVPFNHLSSHTNVCAH